MVDVILPEFLKPVQCDDLVRLGRDYDGGYLVSKRDILNSEVLVGLGINDDWSFESGFSEINDCDVYAYDGSVSGKLFFKKMLRSLFRLNRPDVIVDRFKTFFGYREYFDGRRRHFEKFVGLNKDDETVVIGDIFDRINNRNVFFKIDIEGWEYRILDSIVDHSEILEGMVVEFHDCDLHIDKISNFIDEVGLNLVHVHANNCSPVSENKIPLALELTFSSQCDGKSFGSLPHQLDMPNNKTKDDVSLGFL